MKCKWCHDKKKYGGPGRLNKRCITRRCTNPKVVEMTDHPRPKTKLIRVRTEDGGPGRLNKRCITRRCTNPKVVETTDHPRPKTKLIRVRTEDGGNELIVAPPVRTTYIQGGLVKQMACRACE